MKEYTIDTVVMVGHALNEYTGRKERVFVRVEYNAPYRSGKKDELSFTGRVGSSSFGQCIDTLKKAMRYPNKKEGWTAASVHHLHTLWDKYHLNGMDAACEHQKVNWPLQSEITEQNWRMGPRYFERERNLKNGDVQNMDEYHEIIALLKATENAVSEYKGSRALAEGIVADLIEDRFLEESSSRTVAATSVFHSENPLGFLKKPCEVCGYEYGTSWNYTDVPEHHLLWLSELKETKELCRCMRAL